MGRGGGKSQDLYLIGALLPVLGGQPGLPGKDTETKADGVAPLLACPPLAPLRYQPYRLAGGQPVRLVPPGE